MATNNPDTDFKWFKRPPYIYDAALDAEIHSLETRIDQLRSSFSLAPETERRLTNRLRADQLRHSNAIAGIPDHADSPVSVDGAAPPADTKTIPHRDEAHNLGDALDYLDDLSKNTDYPVTTQHVREIHIKIMTGIREDAGEFREDNVRISKSEHRPTDHFQLKGELNDFFEWLKGVSYTPEFGVIQTAAVAQVWFVSIHPFSEGNGRTARALTDLILMRSGYPISIVKQDDRDEYYDAMPKWNDDLPLEDQMDITQFVRLVVNGTSETIEKYERTASEERREDEWAKSFVTSFNQDEEILLRNEYEHWTRQWEGFVNHYQSLVDRLNREGALGVINIHPYGLPEFETFALLAHRKPVRYTAFFEVQMTRRGTEAKYRHTFRWAWGDLRKYAAIALELGRCKERRWSGQGRTLAPTSRP